MSKRLESIVLFLLFWAVTAAAANRSTIIVFPLDGDVSESLDWLSEGIAGSISDQLEGSTIEAMGRGERTRLVESLDLPPGAQLSRGSMIRVAQRGGADFIVMGSYSGTEQNLRVGIRVFDVKALRIGGEVVANGPLSAIPQMENELAWLILRNKNLEQGVSREKFQERTRKVPNAAYAYFIQSFDETELSERLALLQKAVQVQREFPEAQIEISRIYFNKGDCGNVLRHLSRESGNRASRMEGDFMRGTCHVQEEQYTQAIQELWRLLQGIQSYEGLNNLGVAYVRKGDLALALNAFQDARNLSRTDPAVLANLAIVRHIQGNDAAARAVLEEALKSNPTSGMLHFLLGIVLKAQGENEKASITTGMAKGLGLDVEKLEGEEAKNWCRLILHFPTKN